MTVKLLSNWHEILTKAWSVRLFALSLLLDCLGIWLSVRGVFIGREGPALWLQIGGALVGAAGFIARFMYQRGLSKEVPA